MTVRNAPSIIETFQQRGILFPVAALSMDEVSKARAGLESLAAHQSPCLSIGWSHLFFPWSYELVRHHRILDVVASLLGPDLLVQGTLILTKPAGYPGFMCWHQDGLHTNYDPSRALTAWIALTPSSRDSGAMRVLPGSHATRLPHREVSHPLEMARNAARVELEIATEKVEHVELQPGEMSLHHPFLVHGSGPNTSVADRIGFIVRYGTPHTRVTEPVLPVRGGGDYRHLRVVEPPVHQAGQSMIDTWRKFERDRVLPGELP